MKNENEAVAAATVAEWMARASGDHAPTGGEAVIRSVLFLLLAVLASARPARAQTIVKPVRDVLNECRCVAADLPNALLNIETVDHEFLHDGDQYVVAFWTSLDFGSAEPLHLIAGDLRQGTWKQVTISVPVDIYRSRISRVHRIDDLIFVDLDYSIDDYAIPVLTSDLGLRGWIEGRVTTVWPNGVVAFTPHQPHFGPHYVGVSLFDPRTGKQAEIYPPNPCQPVRCGYAQRLHQAGAGPDPFIESDGAMMPEAFNWSRHALAFMVQLKNEHNMVTPPGWTEAQTVIAVCDHLERFESSTCREMPIDDWRKAFPGLTDNELTERAAASPLAVRP